MSDDNAQAIGAWRSLLDPPYSLELLADLHAGALEGGLAEQLWPRVVADPDAAAVLVALDDTVEQLHGMAALPPSVPMPAELAARIDELLAAQTTRGTSSTPALTPVTELGAARARRARRGTYLGIGVLTAAAAAAAVFALGTGLGSRDIVGTPQAGPPAEQAPPARPTPLDLGSGALGPQALAAVGKQDLGPLSDKPTLAGCLQANGLPPTITPIGASEVVLDGRPGVLLLLPTGRPAVFTALVVGPECAVGNPATRQRMEIGGR